MGPHRYLFEVVRTSAAVLLFFFGMVKLCATSKHTGVAWKSPTKLKPCYDPGSITADDSTGAAASHFKVLVFASLTSVIIGVLVPLNMGWKLPHAADTTEAAPSPIKVLSCGAILGALVLILGWNLPHTTDATEAAPSPFKITSSLLSLTMSNNGTWSSVLGNANGRTLQEKETADVASLSSSILSVSQCIIILCSDFYTRALTLFIAPLVIPRSYLSSYRACQL